MVMLYLLIQILIMRNIVFFDYAFCFIYVGGILILPAEVSRVYLLFIGFATGFMVDAFSNTFGMHAAATVLIAYARPYLMQYQMESRGIERVDVGIRVQGFMPFLGYIFPLIFLHHAVLFLIEMNNFGMILPTLLRIIASAIFTTVMIVLIELFSKR
jgi:hypothetical protein